jgi:hypothetical protein
VWAPHFPLVPFRGHGELGVAWSRRDQSAPRASSRTMTVGVSLCVRSLGDDHRSHAPCDARDDVRCHVKLPCVLLSQWTERGFSADGRPSDYAPPLARPSIALKTLIAAWFAVSAA